LSIAFPVAPALKPIMGLLINFSEATLKRFAFLVFWQNFFGRGGIRALVLKAFAYFLDNLLISFCILRSV
jgi:hypothetical protein